jgi:hypothetical protein
MPLPLANTNTPYKYIHASSKNKYISNDPQWHEYVYLCITHTHAYRWCYIVSLFASLCLMQAYRFVGNETESKPIPCKHSSPSLMTRYGLKDQLEPLTVSAINILGQAIRIGNCPIPYFIVMYHKQERLKCMSKSTLVGIDLYIGLPIYLADTDTNISISTTWISVSAFELGFSQF